MAHHGLARRRAQLADVVVFVVIDPRRSPQLVICGHERRVIVGPPVGAGSL
jgi:hypothetical protein